MNRAVVGLAIALVAAACSTPPVPTAPPNAPTGLDPGHVLVAVEDVGGWPGMEGTAEDRLLTLTADGTLIARARGGLVVSGPTMRVLDRESLDDAWAAVAGRGLAVDGSFDLPGLFDATTTTIRVDDGTGATLLSIYGLTSQPPDTAFADDERQFRANADAAIAELLSLTGDEPWTPPSLLLWWAPDEEAPSGAQPRVVEWTPAVDLATAGKPVDTPVYRRCVRLDDGDAADVAALARMIPGDVVVVQDGTRYQIGVRAIYPDELGSVDCP